MKKKFNRVYQFRITLEGIRPPVLRRMQVPETYTFWDLHVAIQDIMEWSDCHLHQFSIIDPRISAKVNIGIPDEEDDYYEILPGWEQKIADYFSHYNKTAEYIYDFGNYWEHSILFERILPRENSVAYPLCVEGRRACPPEDIGGPGGYEQFLEIIMDPRHERYEEMLKWAGDFEPECFDKDAVVFDDPAKRFKTLKD